MKHGLLQRYGKHLPIGTATPIISLGEGSTPLVRSRELAKILNCSEVYFKLEGSNPTGSFKDRGMVLAVAKAIENSSAGIICASTGNTSASAAAYGARFGLPTVVLMPKGNVAEGKLIQAKVHGANIIMIDGNFDSALRLVNSLVEKHPLTLVNSLNPYRLEGQKTAAFEIIDQFGEAPDILSIPVGNAGNITAYWKGFTEYRNAGYSNTLPIMMGFQAKGAAPIVLNHPVENPTTVASAIRIGNPANWNSATKVRDESGGIIDSVDDEEIISAYRMMASREGIFCEPASAAGVAGLIKLRSLGMEFKGKRLVCIITGLGLKDPDLPSSLIWSDIIQVGTTFEEVETALLNYTLRLGVSNG